MNESKSEVINFVESSQLTQVGSTSKLSRARVTCVACGHAPVFPTLSVRHSAAEAYSVNQLNSVVICPTLPAQAERPVAKSDLI